MASIHFGEKLEPTQRGFGNRVPAAQSAGNLAGATWEHEFKTHGSNGKAKLEFEINSRERGARSNFEENGIDARRVTEPSGQLSVSKRGTNFREVLRSINFSPPQAFDENGVHRQCRGHQADDIVIP
jgi:hypothetical protein